MLAPYNVDVPMQRLPIANWLLIAVTSVASLVVLGDPRSAEPLILQRSHFAFPQLVGYLLVHGSLLHLIGNMLFLFCFGNAVNAKLGHVQFLLLYAALGMLAGGAWLVLGEGGGLIGASGAIMGITGVFLVLYPRNDVCVFYWLFAYGGSFRVTSFWLVLLYMAFDFWGTLGSSGGVAYVAHLAGELAGIGAALALVTTGMVVSDPGEQNLAQLLGLQPETPRRPSRR